jgi:acyl carrier protein
LDLRVQFRADVFDAATIEALIEGFKRVLVAMTADATQPLSSMDVLDEAESATVVEQLVAGVYAAVLGIDDVGVDESFFDVGGDSLSAMRAVAAINSALDIQLPVAAIFDAPSARDLSRQLGRHASRLSQSPGR